jgi:hypothetical protein
MWPAWLERINIGVWFVPQRPAPLPTYCAACGVQVLNVIARAFSAWAAARAAFASAAR